jgi:methylated-DNA-[protein]-cysteine S-methyltransferase
MTDLAWGTLSAPVGRLSVGCGQAGVSQIRWGYPPGGPRPLDAAAGPAAQQCSAALGQLGEYFAGQRRQFEVPVDWSGMSRLQRQVLGVLLHTVGYGESLPARAIGRIMGSNPIPVIVPCHRVVAADGLGGYSGGTGGNGLEVKRWLLSFEGALPPELDFSLASSEV